MGRAQDCCISTNRIQQQQDDGCSMLNDKNYHNLIQNSGKNIEKTYHLSIVDFDLC